MLERSFLCFLAAVALAGCGGGGGGGSAGSVSLVPSVPSGPAGGDSSSGSSTINEGALAENSLRAYSSQFSAAAAQVSGTQREEVYDPKTQSSVASSFAQATLAAATTSRKGSAFLIASSAYGIAPAAQDLISAIGVGADGYTFLDTGSKDVSNRSAYQSTSENSLVNILSNPLYTKRGSKLVGGLIISPDDIRSHGWIVSDTGFDGNVDPVAGITGRGWLSKHKADIAYGYRQAAATGKVRLFYGLTADGESRHSASNGCKGFEQYCLGAPYSLRVKNGQGRYTDVEGAFVSTYGFAAYVMAWERMPADTHIAKVFELGDECAHDLGEAGADAATGLGRLDVGCMADRIYQASVVVEEDAPVVVPPPVVVKPTPTATVSVTTPVPEEKEVPEEVPPEPVVVKPTPTVTVSVTTPVPEDKEVPEEVPPEPVVVKPTPTATVSVTTPVPEDKEVPEKVSPEPVVVKPTPTVATSVEVVQGKKKRALWFWKKSGADNMNNEFARLGLTVTTSRKQNAYLIRYRPCKEVWQSRRFPHGPNEFYCLHSHANRQFENIHKSLKKMDHGGYTLLRLVDKGPSRVNYDETYQSSSENSLVSFAINPFYLGPISSATAAIWLNPDNIPDHGWIVTETGRCYADYSLLCGDNAVNSHIRQGHEFFVDHRKKVPWEQSEDMTEKLKEMRASYQQALATGKVRLFYSLDVFQTERWPHNLDCQDFEEYCIGLPNPHNTGLPHTPMYGFGLYLMAWERMPAETHISAIFAMGDRCTEDLGEPGPDADTGLGRLDVGCMTFEVYKVNLNPSAATLSVAARKPSSSSTDAPSANQLFSAGADGSVQLQAQGSPPRFAGSSGDPARQQFFDDFAQELFSHLGSLWLPGSTQAGFSIGFPGDSFEGTYRPARDAGLRYDVVAPSPRYALSAGNIGLMGTEAGEIGIFTRIEGIDISFSYAASEDFFGGSGSGDFAFERVGNTRLMLQRQMLPETSDHSLVAGAWVRHAAVSGSKGRLLDALQGSEYGLSFSYAWQRGDGLQVEASAFAARFAGGEVDLAGGNRFAIASGDWQWGAGLVGRYEF